MEECLLGHVVEEYAQYAAHKHAILIDAAVFVGLSSVRRTRLHQKETVLSEHVI